MNGIESKRERTLGLLQQAKALLTARLAELKSDPENFALNCIVKSNMALVSDLQKRLDEYETMKDIIVG
jgi:hypothetical protein